jgi:hypothetical protein
MLVKVLSLENKGGLTRSVMINHVVGKILFLNMKGHSHKRSMKPVSTSSQQLNQLCLGQTDIILQIM